MKYYFVLRFVSVNKFSILHCFFQTTDLIRALQELENAASGDAAVHQRIASLPIEVQDVSLLDRITGEGWGIL